MKRRRTAGKRVGAGPDTSRSRWPQVNHRMEVSDFPRRLFALISCCFHDSRGRKNSEEISGEMSEGPPKSSWKRQPRGLFPVGGLRGPLRGPGPGLRGTLSPQAPGAAVRP